MKALLLRKKEANLDDNKGLVVNLLNFHSLSESNFPGGGERMLGNSPSFGTDPSPF